MTQTMTPRQRICRAICKSGQFETGQGTCAFICMDQLGDPRKKDCPHAWEVHARLADSIVKELVGMQSKAYDEPWEEKGR
jgi:hypothetical protein